MAKQLMDTVIHIEELTEDIYSMTLESEFISGNALPGQFVNIKCCEGEQALLRRPVSICRVDRNSGTYDILFQKKGTGTALLACKNTGDRLDVLGPLGNGFDLNIGYERIAVVGGGIGIFPLLFLLQESKAILKNAYLGFRTADLLVLEKEFIKSSSSLKIATDDGSYGTHGYITEILKNDLLSELYDMIYACGPTAMLKIIAQLAEESGTECQISLEQRMGCGFGACLICACKTKTKSDADAKDGQWHYSHVCKDGPVFNSREIIFECENNRKQTEGLSEGSRS